MGLIHIYCGDGKGKTTAAAGLALRARGRGLPVLFQQYLKDGRSAELVSLQKLGAEIASGMPEEASGFSWTLNDEQKKILKDFQNVRLEQAADWFNEHKDGPGVLVLDEILATMQLQLADEEKLWALLDLAKQYPAGPDVVLTGRDPSEKLCEAADYLSEIKAVKHPFEKGIKARPGIEY